DVEANIPFGPDRKFIFGPAGDLVDEQARHQMVLRVGRRPQTHLTRHARAPPVRSDDQARLDDVMLSADAEGQCWRMSGLDLQIAYPTKHSGSGCLGGIVKRLAHVRVAECQWTGHTRNELAE